MEIAHDQRLPLRIVDDHGSAIAIGHPLDASGPRLIGTLAKTLREHHHQWGLISVMGSTSAVNKSSQQSDRRIYRRRHCRHCWAGAQGAVAASRLTSQSKRLCQAGAEAFHQHVDIADGRAVDIESKAAGSGVRDHRRHHRDTR